jgi:hypothetical protein
MHSSFESLAKKTGNDQQYCWSHIICDAKELEDFYGDERIIKESLQEIYEKAKSFNGTPDDVNKIHEKMIFLLERDYEHRKTGRFVKNLLNRKKELLFRFAIDPDV